MICDGVDSAHNSDHFAPGRFSPMATQPQLGVWTKRRDWSAVGNRADSAIAEDYLGSH